MVKLVDEGYSSLTCPDCRQITPIPANGIRGLQAAFQINKFLEIVEEHKNAIDAGVNAEKGDSHLVSSTSVPVGCLEHCGKEVDLYCETCGEMICWKCIMKGSMHHSHNYSEVNEAYEKYKKEIASSLEPMEEQLKIIDKALKRLDLHCDAVSNQQVAIEVGQEERADRPTPPTHCSQAEEPCSPERPAGNHPGTAQQLSLLNEGQPQ